MSRENRERLREGLRAGLIDTIGSDHSPVPPALKHLDSGDLQKAWGGIASLQLTLPLVWTMAQEWTGCGFMDLAEWLSRRPAELVSLAGRKGALAPGCDADMVVFDSEAEVTVTSAGLHHRHKVTPYDGQKLRGRVEKTYLRGHKVFDAGRFEDAPRGNTLLHRGHNFHGQPRRSGGAIDSRHERVLAIMAGAR